MYIKQIGLFALAGFLSSSCSSLWSDPVVVTKITDVHGIPVFWAKSSYFKEGYGGLKAGAAVSAAVIVGNDPDLSDRSVPFRTADIRGKLRRVNVDGTDVAVIDNVRLPFLGTKFTNRELKKRVVAKATVLTGCKKQEGVFVQVQTTADITGFAVPLLCEISSVNNVNAQTPQVPIKNTDTQSQKLSIKKASN